DATPEALKSRGSPIHHKSLLCRSINRTCSPQGTARLARKVRRGPPHAAPAAYTSPHAGRCARDERTSCDGRKTRTATVRGGTQCRLRREVAHACLLSCPAGGKKTR